MDTKNTRRATRGSDVPPLAGRPSSLKANEPPPDFSWDSINRRTFLRLMGASFALGGIGLTGCRRPEGHLVPYTASPEWVVPGKPLIYATAAPAAFGGVPLFVTTYEGRPTHLEANRLFSDAGLTPQIQASILDLYDPDRAVGFLENGYPAGRQRFTEFLGKAIGSWREKKGAGLAVIVEPTVSPTLAGLRGELQKRYPEALLSTYSPLGSGGRSAAARGLFGERLTLLPRWGEADVILSVGCDFASGDQEGPSAIRGIAARRRLRNPEDEMNRIYVVEERLTSAGAFADHRLALRVGDHAAFLAMVARELAAGGLWQLEPFGRLAEEGWGEPVQKWAKLVARDLVQAKRPLIMAGRDAPASVALLALAMNMAFGRRSALALIPPLEDEALPLEAVAEEIRKENVQALLILGANPVYTAPVDLDWLRLQRSVPQVIHLGLLADETAQASHWHAPMAHYLESWGDAFAPDGTYLSAQPMILPFYGALSEIDVLAALCGEAEALRPPESPSPTQLSQPPLAGGPPLLPLPVAARKVQESFIRLCRIEEKDRAEAWRRCLHDGFWAGSAPSPLSPEPRWEQAVRMVAEELARRPAARGLELSFYPCAKIGDGRQANNAWLQELPDFITKLTWDNAVLMGPRTARELGLPPGGGDLRRAELVVLECGGRRLEAAALAVPGHAEGSLSIALGYGRSFGGRVAQGHGFNAYRLRTRDTMRYASGVSVIRTGRSYPVAQSQTHADPGDRGVVREGSLAEYRAVPDFARREDAEARSVPEVSIYPNPYGAKEPGPAYTQGVTKGAYQWGMVIDLGSCVGCNACVIACQSENNIPIVGKGQVIRGRIMQWIRIDRYFTGPEADPRTIPEPMLCQQCENAPCEAVCPVNATVHSEEGLNVMVYNRCIGTRACAANCPYKVRRFNFFDFNKRDVLKTKKIGPWSVGNLYLGPFGALGSPLTVQMQRNPNVTVRMRGVMEKCTFCVQRIEQAKIATLVQARDGVPQRIPRDSVRTACQEACPADAIVFGDLADPESRVSRWKADSRAYRVLEYLNVRPRVSYLARIYNPNPDLGGTESFPKAGEPEKGPSGTAGERAG
ncbi:Anaerobic dehydrogenase and Fe-S-cluster domain [Methylacidimicrobium sp. AP8]|uniref:4Fe-4S dicluster domain-containing protein n=1 Tax=Methylacidimicrobium sp. AP8 TaxID=2730359 RepID=UPI0018C1BC65|nr:4Fe-4S dicluster domain-containing protein [Methylacidimicrobium sp. AP8]CAB4244394.1 Anaerobic dehydrogenase and Fe-S-cluster domain [Methylacidimicrobium sp. AP8]